LHAHSFEHAFKVLFKYMANLKDVFLIDSYPLNSAYFMIQLAY